MNLFPARSHTPEAIVGATLDQVWREAEHLGDIKVEKGIFSNEYEAQIKFKRPAGSTIWAKGQHSNVIIALCQAIDEARELGAKS